MMKKFLSLALTLALVLGLMVPVAFAVEPIEISGKEELSVGESSTYSVPEGYQTGDYSYEWTSPSKSVSIDDKTKASIEVKGVQEATSIQITCNIYTTGDSKELTATGTKSITVTPAKLSRVDLTQTTLLSLPIGNSKTITATAYDTNGEKMKDQTYTWTYDGPVVSIDPKNDSITVTGMKEGNATIVCSVTSEGITKTNSFNVYVSSSSSTSTATTKLTGVSLNNSTLTIDVGDTETLKATPSGTCDKEDVDFTWTSSNTSVAYITSDDGEGEYTAKIKGKKAGTATITCTAEYGSSSYYKTCKVTVEDDDDDDFRIKTDLPSSQTAVAGVSSSISFTVTDTTDTEYQWYVDGSKDNSSSKNSFNLGNLSVGSHKVYCVATNDDGDEATTTVCNVTVMSSASSGSMNNFKVAKTYNGEFTDVNAPTESNPDDWFYPYVKTSYEYGLVNGKGSTTTFCPNDSFTIAEALKIAACIHSTYRNGSDATQTNLVDKAGTGADWYKVYVDYCTEKGIITSTDFPDYNANCTRAQMAYIFSRCLPSSELTAVRTVTIPDCNSNTPYYSNIQTLYNAGIVSGDATHSYYPDNPIKRSEMAKIVCTLVVPSTRDKATF